MTTCCTAEGSRRYAERHGNGTGAYPETQGLALSSIGLGTYLGDATDEADARYTEAIYAALAGGCNVLDTAINYRNQRSERCVGAALKQAIEEGIVQRDEVFVSTKGGFVPFDGHRPENPQGYFTETFIDPGHCAYEDVVAGCHVMTPGYLNFQLERSLANLGLESVDLYYIHNPEIQLTEVDGVEFNRRLSASFQMLEDQVAAGRIRFYGTATWNGYRVRPSDKEYLNLAALGKLAEDVGGKDHHFRFIQLPVNLGMAEAFRAQNQDGGITSAVELANRLGISVMASGSISQGRLASALSAAIADQLGQEGSNVQRCLNLVRSIPGVSTALVGMGRKEHVEENLKTLALAPLSGDTIEGLYA